MHHFAKTQTTHNRCSKRSILFCELSVTTTRPVALKVIGKFSIVHNKTNHESFVALLLYEVKKHFKVQMLHE